MPWIYRYIDEKDNITKYVGLVYGNSTEQLFKRLYAHERDFDLLDNWKPYKDHNFTIQVLNPEQVKTKADAEILEAHFINKFESNKYLNIAKADWGTCSLINDDKFHWETLSYNFRNKTTTDSFSSAEVDNISLKYESKIADLQKELTIKTQQLSTVLTDYEDLKKQADYWQLTQDIFKDEIQKLTEENIDLKLLKEITFSKLSPEQQNILYLNNTINKLNIKYTELKEKYDKLYEWSKKDRDTILDQTKEILDLRNQLNNKPCNKPCSDQEKSVKIKKGLLKRKLAGEQVGLQKGTKLTTKKSVTAKEFIKLYSADFDGDLTDKEVMNKIGHISRNSYYKYKKELAQMIQGENNQLN